MESLFDMLNNSNFWKIPIYKKPISSKAEEDFINNMAHDVLMSNKIDILNITYKIVNRELKKCSIYDMRKRLLIQNQIHSNMIENITNTVFNIAKDYYDEYIREHEIVEITQPKLDLVDDDPCVDVSI